MEKYKKLNILTGWFAFLVAAVVYILTIEPTVSFWDCGEFISSSYKLEVGHPPGAPFFMIMARFFSLFAPDVTKVAMMVNIMSALASAFTILFLFWTITHLARKIFITDGQYDTGKILAVLGSGLIGALAYTFSDTFWFSAVEGEVYATSSLFTAVVFWAILKWENEANEKHATRWLFFIAFLMGISIGIHLLNLLAIPAIVLVFYFKRYKPTKKGVLLALLVSFLILGFIMYGMIKGVVVMGSYMELLFVNVFHLPFNSGLLFYALLLAGIMGWAMYVTHLRGKKVLNTVIVCVGVILIGYFSYALIIIRSQADPPMDQNNPEHAFTLLSYLNREQYGDTPLLHGAYYNAPVINSKKGKPTYRQIDGRYKVTKYGTEYEYDQRFTGLFPRMWSANARHIRAYKQWGRVDGNPVTIMNNRGEEEQVVIPTFGQNIRFFLRYQVGFMYMRYFMWNFTGRQNDIQGHGSAAKGNWISGIKSLDEARLGPQDKLPDDLENNPGRNKYYMLPLLLGIIGLLFHYNTQKKDFFVVLLLFFMTGIAIVIYLNQYPFQPRERDYAYAGSFYAFAIWIGLGVAAICRFLGKKIPMSLSAVLSTLLCFLFVPAVMAKENWDDHDRSGRYTARDFAYNYLNTCAPNAILFTNGDNDTFPLWYAQEVEGIRTDVRVVNLSYIGADWYIEQIKRKAYESDPVPISFNKDQYRQGTKDVVYMIDRMEKYVELRRIIDFVKSDNKDTKVQGRSGEYIDYMPTHKMKISIDSARMVDEGIVSSKDAQLIVPEMKWEINKNYMIKNDVITLDILTTSNWKRPVYYAITVSHSSYLNLEKYFQLEGFAYRVVPIENKSKEGDVGRVNPDILYENLMNKFKWGNITDPDVYLNEDNRRMLSNLRSNFARLAGKLIDKNKSDSAIKVIDRCVELVPHKRLPFSFFMLPMAEGYFKLDQTEKAREVVEKIKDNCIQYLDYYSSLGNGANALSQEKRLHLHVLQQLVRITGRYDQDKDYTPLKQAFNDYMMKMNPPTNRRY